MHLLLLKINYQYLLGLWLLIQIQAFYKNNNLYQHLQIINSKEMFTFLDNK